MLEFRNNLKKKKKTPPVSLARSRMCAYFLYPDSCGRARKVLEKLYFRIFFI